MFEVDKDGQRWQKAVSADSAKPAVGSSYITTYMTQVCEIF